MSKQLEALAALLVKGARVTLKAFTIDGVKATNTLVDREQLIVEVDEKGVSLIISEPKSAAEMGRRYWTSPRPQEVEVKGDSFTLTTGAGGKESPKMVYSYSVVKPPVELTKAPASEQKEDEAPAAPAEVVAAKAAEAQAGPAKV